MYEHFIRCVFFIPFLSSFLNSPTEQRNRRKKLCVCVLLLLACFCHYPNTMYCSLLFSQIKMYQKTTQANKRPYNKISKIELKHIYEDFMSFPQATREQERRVTTTTTAPATTYRRRERKKMLFIFGWMLFRAVLFLFRYIFLSLLCSAVTCMRYYMNSILFNPLLHFDICIVFSSFCRLNGLITTTKNTNAQENRPQWFRWPIERVRRWSIESLDFTRQLTHSLYPQPFAHSLSLRPSVERKQQRKEQKNNANIFQQTAINWRNAAFNSKQCDRNSITFEAFDECLTESMCPQCCCYMLTHSLHLCLGRPMSLKERKNEQRCGR